MKKTYSVVVSSASPSIPNGTLMIGSNPITINGNYVTIGV